MLPRPDLRMILVLFIAGLFCALGCAAVVFRAQRDSARLEAGELRLTLEGYRLAAQAQAVQIQSAAEEADHLGASTRVLVQELHAKVPKTDEEARAWAIEAARRIGK